MLTRTKTNAFLCNGCGRWLKDPYSTNFDSVRQAHRHYIVSRQILTFLKKTHYIDEVYLSLKSTIEA